PASGINLAAWGAVQTTMQLMLARSGVGVSDTVASGLAGGMSALRISPEYGVMTTFLGTGINRVVGTAVQTGIQTAMGVVKKAGAAVASVKQFQTKVDGYRAEYQALQAKGGSAPDTPAKALGEKAAQSVLGQGSAAFARQATRGGGSRFGQ
ncbi:hypothetical protein KIPB_005756, partial [Kipferlia bialata]